MCRATGTLSPVATDAAGKLDVLREDGHPLGVDGAEVGVLEERHEVGLRGLLQSHHAMAVEAGFLEELVGDLLHKPLEGKLADKEFRGLLVLADLTESNGARTETVRLLEAMGRHLATTTATTTGRHLARSHANVHAGNLLDTGHCCARRAYCAIDRTQCNTVKM